MIGQLGKRGGREGGREGRREGRREGGKEGEREREGGREGGPTLVHYPLVNRDSRHEHDWPAR